MTVQRRIARALAANAFGQVVTVGTQLLLTPLFFWKWGAGLYGEWLILSSIPAYLTMADLGLGSAAGNEMTMRAGAGDHSGAQKTYRGAMWVGLWAGSAVLLVGVFLAVMAACFQIPHTKLITAQDSAFVIVLLSLNVAMGFQGGVISAGFRAAGYNAQGIMLSNTSRLMEALVMGAMLILGQGPLILGAAALGIKGIMLVVQHIWLKRLCTWLFVPKVPADLHMVKRLLAPSLGFMAFPLGNALALQGPILIIGHALGGPAVAIFSAVRTLARLPIQIANIFNSSVWPEMSRAHGAGDSEMLRRLHRGSWALTVLLVVCCGLGLIVLGRWLAYLWLGPEVTFDPVILNGLVIVTVLSAAWNASAVVMSATNAHLGLGLRYVVVNAVCIGLAWFLTPSMQWLGLLSMLLLAELFLLVWVLPKVLKLTGDTPNEFFAGSWLELKHRLMRLMPLPQ
jgi:O-antigen/teichoic acid export membrane protein